MSLHIWRRKQGRIHFRDRIQYSSLYKRNKTYSPRTQWEYKIIWHMADRRAFAAGDITFILVLLGKKQNILGKCRVLDGLDHGNLNIC
jgi:hypothetical protein